MPRKAATKTRSSPRTTKATQAVKSKKLRKDETEEESTQEEDEEEEDTRPKPKRGGARKKSQPKTKKGATKKDESEDEEEDDAEETQTAKKRKTNAGKGKAAKVVKPSAKEKILPRSFYTKDVFTVSKALLGKVIVRKVDDEVIKCRIVDVEAFAGTIDKASHAYNNRRNVKNEVLYGEAGHAYLFTLQQVNAPCLNITVSKKGDPCAAMIRGVEILEGMDTIAESRGNLSRVSKSGKEYTNGPGKLSKALQLDRSLNEHDLTKAGEFYIIEGDGSAFEMVTTRRVKIDYAEEFNTKPWRYCIKGNAFLSAPATPARAADYEDDDEEEEEEDDE